MPASPLASDPRPADRAADRWVLDACQRAGLRAASVVLAGLGDCDDLMESAWDALTAAGADEHAILLAICTASVTRPADLAAITPALSAQLSDALASRFGVVPVSVDARGTLTVATAAPFGTIEQDLAFALGRRIEITAATPSAIADAFATIYGHAPVAWWASPGAGAPVVTDVPPIIAEASVVDCGGAAPGTVEAVLGDAMVRRASDLHFEPAPDGSVLVRFRTDGALNDAARFPREQAPGVIRRLKIMARLDIADSLRPQDGRATVVYEGRSVDLRVSTLPLGAGLEKVVLRVLDGATSLNLNQLGFTPAELAAVERIVGMLEGLVLVVGPTGSGKTTTLYSVLRAISKREHNIVTVEDPVEYKIKGITQVQVNEKARMTFASALRSLLRQDPDVVFVGEIRDGETAEVGIKASMTGHLVLSTLHTADAVSTVDRLYGMGVEAQSLATALKGIVAQRLVRRLCTTCAESVALRDLPLHQQALLAGHAHPTLKRPVGCAACDHTGYRGRILVCEVVSCVPAIQRAIARRADVQELGAIVRECGMQSMWAAGIERVIDGTTSLAELLDNLPAPMDQGVVVPAGSAGAPTPGAAPMKAAAPALPSRAATAATAATAARPVPLAPRVPLPPPAATSAPARPVARARAAPPSALPHATPSAPVSAPREPEPRTLVAPARPTITTADAPPAPAAAADALRVLLVDDDAAARRELADALIAEGLQVIEAADGRVALAYAREIQPHCIIAEVALPRLDAAGLVQAIEAMPDAPPVIVCTRQTDLALLDFLVRAGCAEAVSRPVVPADLAALAHRVVIERASRAA